MEKTLNERESLRLINEMIVQTRDNVRKGDGNFMIAAGYIVAALAILDFILLHVLDKPYMAHWVWALMLPYFIVSQLAAKAKARSQAVKTYADAVVAAVWTAFGYSVFLCLAVIFWAAYALGTWQPTVLITPVILSMTGLAQFVTARACRYKPFLYGAVIFWLGTPLSILFMDKFHLIILAACIILGFVIPGHNLNRKAKRNV
jgi:hypothetical protein